MWTKLTETSALKSIQSCFKADGPTIVERNTSTSPVVFVIIYDSDKDVFAP